ncbi:DNA phosphorothioation-dependent restriction protein DptF [Pontibacter sp. G13]|uniref:DNA phosphorothioation-dependent restriction protein DptF n=1 Tax=Pontibacter sp. G13 TaxID=3074898 RepID=UPI00288B453E|nr:DNA phosphorothioation-dependent restriction protein DptF [Pontibacter sp. G13]WNJ17162.1 DNA phosphorothioation-dependent restriction protein DptF [Pontibacter sp. G13]
MLNHHPLVFELEKLKESSREAVADSNAKIEDELKKYLHIERPVETHLRDIISKAKESDKAQLILVCGNVGDGKSHILSLLKDDIGTDFKVHNDATESFEPQGSCIDTLDEILTPFSDENIESARDKWILAINLGTLSNFLEEKSDRYQELRKYVEKNQILSSDVDVEPEQEEHQYFKFVNFTDYHLYTLTSQGIKAAIVDDLFDKVAANDKKNPIYRAYLSIKDEPWGEKCPVVLNYEFFLKEPNRKLLSSLLIQVLLKEKKIFSFRRLLNFIHDIIVPYNLELSSFDEYTKKIVTKWNTKKLPDYLIPFYLFENPNISKIFKGLGSMDPCLSRIEKLDERLIHLNITDKPSEHFQELLTEYSQAKELLEAIDKNNEKEKISRLYIRLYFFAYYREFEALDYFKDYSTALYAFNSGNIRALRSSYDMVKEAILKWNGNTSTMNKVLIPLAVNQEKYRVFKDVELEEVLPKKSTDKEVFLQFYPQLKLTFEHPSEKGKEITVDIDYSLYVLLRMVIKGYRPNQLDRRNYIKFTRFLDELTLSGASNQKLYVDEVNLGKAIDFIIAYNSKYEEFTFSKN